MDKSKYSIDFEKKLIEVYDIKGVGKLIASLQALLKDWKTYTIKIKNNG